MAHRNEPLTGRRRPKRLARANQVATPVENGADKPPRHITLRLGEADYAKFVRFVMENKTRGRGVPRSMQAVLHVALKEYLARHTTGTGVEPAPADRDSLSHALSALGIALQRVSTQRVSTLLGNGAAGSGRVAKRGTEDLAEAITAALTSALKL